LNHVSALPTWHLQHAEEQAAQGRLSDALLSASAAVALGPSLVEARKLYGKLLWNAGQYGAAMDQFRAAVDAASDDQEAASLLRTAEGQLASRRRRRLAGASVGVFLLVCLLVIPYATRPDIDSSAGARSEPPERASTQPNADLSTLEREFAEYRALHVYGNAEYIELQTAISRYVSFSTNALVRVQHLRPYDADDLAAQAERIRAEIDECEQMSTKYERRRDLLGTLLRRKWKRRHERAQTQLAECEQQQELRVKPWAELLGDMQRDLVALRSDVKTDETSTNEGERAGSSLQGGAPLASGNGAVE